MRTVRALIVAILVVPPIAAVIGRQFHRGDGFFPVSWLVLNALSSAVVLGLYYWLAHMELRSAGETVALPRAARVILAGFAMIIIATLITVSMVQATASIGPGFSTNAIIVVLFPGYLLSAGLGTYYVGWLAGAVIQKVLPSQPASR